MSKDPEVFMEGDLVEITLDKPPLQVLWRGRVQMDGKMPTIWGLGNINDFYPEGNELYDMGYRIKLLERAPAPLLGAATPPDYGTPEAVKDEARVQIHTRIVRGVNRILGRSGR